MARGRFGHRDIRDGRVKIQLDSTVIDVNAHINTTRGFLALTAARKGSDLTGLLQLNQLDVMGLMNMEDSSRVTALARLEGRWPPDTLSLDVAVDPSSWRSIALDNGGVHVSVQGYNVDFVLRADTEVGSTQARGSMNLEMQPPAWTLQEAKISDLDIGSLGLPYRSNISGTLQFAGRGTDQVSGLVSFDHSSFNDQVLDSAHVTLDMRADRAQLEGRFSLSDGSLDLAVEVDSLFDESVITLQRAQFEGLNLGAVLGQPDWQTHLSGEVDSLYFRAARSPVAALRMRIDTSHVNDMIVHGGMVYAATGEDGVSARMRLELPGGHVLLDTLQLMPDSVFMAQGTIEQLDLQALTGIDAMITGSFDVTGSGSELTTLSVENARISAGGSVIGGVTFNEANLFGEVHDGLIIIDTLAMDTNVGSVHGGGEFALQGGTGESMELYGVLTNASPLEPWLGPVTGGGAPEDTFRVHLETISDTIRFAASLGLGPVTLGTTRVLNTTAGVRGYAVDFNPTFEQAFVRLTRVSVPALAARNAELVISQSGDTVNYEAHVMIDNRRNARVQGYADLTQGRVVLQDLGMRLDQDDWHLDQEAVILVGDNYRVRNLLLVEDSQEVALDGVLDFEGQQSLGLSLFNVQLDRFADLFGFEGLGGTVDGDLFLRGPAGAPILDGSLTMEVREIDTSVGLMRVDMGYEDYRFAIDAELTHADGSTMHLAGHLPADLRLQRDSLPPEVDVSLVLQSDELNVGWLSPFLDPEQITDLRGRLSADVHIAGTTQHPHMIGSAALSDASMILPAAGISLSDVVVETRMAGDTVYVSTLTAYSGEGPLYGDGHVVLERLNQATLDITASMENFQVVDTRPYEAEADATLHLTGTLTRPFLTGRVDVAGAVIRPQDAPQGIQTGSVAFTEADVQMLERYFNIRVTEADTTTFTLMNALAMDITVGIPGNVWLRSRQNPEMDIVLAGSLTLTKAPFEDQQLIGTVSIVPQRSYVRQFGRRFDIRNGRVTFAGSVTDPFFEIEAAMAVRNQDVQASQVTILLEAAGQLQDTDTITLDFKSEPVQLDPADIILYIATGRPAADTFQGTNTLEAGSSLAISQLNSLIAGAASAGLGLDVVRIQQDGARGLTATAGEYISRRLFASVSWPVAADDASDASRLGSNKALVIEYAFFFLVGGPIAWRCKCCRA